MTQSLAYEIAARGDALRRAVEMLALSEPGTPLPGIVVNGVLYTKALVGDTATCLIRVERDGRFQTFPVAHRPGYAARAPQWQFKNGKLGRIDFGGEEPLALPPLYVAWDRSLGCEVAYDR